MIYIIPLLVMVFCCYYYDYKQNQKGRLVWWIIFLVYLICVAGFRYRMGGDTIVYEKFFNFTPPLWDLKPIYFQESRFAPGFVLLTSFCKSLGDDFMIEQFIIAAFINGVIFWFFWNNTRHVFFALLVYSCFLYLTLNMEVLRESIAVALFLLAWPFFRDGKWLQYYMLCFLGVFFHVSAVVLLLIPLVCVPGIRYFFTFGTRTWVIAGVLLVISLAIGQFFFKYIQLLAVAENVTERAEVYSKSELGGGSVTNVFGFISKAIKYIIYPVAAIYFINILKRKELLTSRAMQKMELLSVASIYISIVSVSIFILSRYNNYLFFFPIVMMSDWVFTFIVYRGKKMRMEFVSWVIIFIPMFWTLFVTYYFNNVNTEGTLKTYMIYYPYENAFTKELDPNREKVFNYMRGY